MTSDELRELAKSLRFNDVERALFWGAADRIDTLEATLDKVRAARRVEDHSIFSFMTGIGRIQSTVASVTYDTRAVDAALGVPEQGGKP